MAPQSGIALPAAGEEVLNASFAVIAGYCPGVCITSLERFAFYETARKCFAVVQTLERRPYGNYVLTKGVVGPDGNDLKP